MPALEVSCRARFEAAVGPLDWPDEAITAMVHWIKRLDPGCWASAHADLDQILYAIEANRVSRTQAK